jgi:hypothetical protein
VTNPKQTLPDTCVTACKDWSGTPSTVLTRLENQLADPSNPMRLEESDDTASPGAALNLTRCWVAGEF